jgi:Tfp pilus assembly protein PilP
MPHTFARGALLAFGLALTTAPALAQNTTATAPETKQEAKPAAPAPAKKPGSTSAAPLPVEKSAAKPAATDTSRKDAVKSVQPDAKKPASPAVDSAKKDVAKPAALDAAKKDAAKPVADAAKKDAAKPTTADAAKKDAAKPVAADAAKKDAAKPVAADAAKKDAAKPVAADAAKKDAAKPVIAPVPSANKDAAKPDPAAGKQTAVVVPEALTTAPQGFTYTARGRRDPFVTLLKRGTDAKEATVTARAAGLAGLASSEVLLRGVLASQGTYVAMLLGADEKTYIVHPGDKLADGTIRTITADSMIIQTKTNDATQKPREIRKKLRQMDGTN